MKISDRYEIPGSNLQKPEKTTGKAERKTEEALSRDQVTVSDRAKEIGRLRVEVSKTPEIRADRVDEVKNAINAGAYNVKGEAVAGKLVKEAIIDSLI